MFRFLAILLVVGFIGQGRCGTYFADDNVQNVKFVSSKQPAEVIFDDHHDDVFSTGSHHGNVRIKESKVHVRFNDDQTFVENYDNTHSNIKIMKPKVTHHGNVHVKESKAHVRFNDDQTYFGNAHSNVNVRIIKPKVTHHGNMHVKESKAHVRFNDDQTYFDNAHSNANVRIIKPQVSHRTKSSSRVSVIPQSHISSSKISVKPQSHISSSQFNSVIPEVSFYRGMSTNEDHQEPIPNQQVLFHKMNTGAHSNSRMSSSRNQQQVKFSRNQQVEFIDADQAETGFYH